MIIKYLTVGFFEQNTILLGCEEKKEAILIDPGGETHEIIKDAEKINLKINAIYLTHAHIDHIMDINSACSILKCPVYIHRDEIQLYKNAKFQGKFFGFHISDPPLPVEEIKDRERFFVGKIEILILHTPGHSPGSCCFYIEKNTPPILISGDTLFYQGIGRTDIFGGSYKEIIKSIKEKLFLLPEETVVYPGHGPETTIGYEKKYNPFF